MSKNVFLILIVAAFAMISACGGADKANTNTNANTNANQANLPEGFSTVPVPISNNSTPGIPPPGSANISINPNGTPTPGIPDPAKMTPVPKGVTPTPGIPDEKTLKQMMKSIPVGNVNSPSSPTNTKVKTVRKP